MAISRENRPIVAEKIPKSSFILLIDSADFEVKLYDKYGMKFSVNIDQLDSVKEKQAWPLLSLRTRYVLRYNNNDRGIGNLDASIIQLDSEGSSRILEKYSIFNINERTVLEMSFYLTYIKPIE